MMTRSKFLQVAKWILAGLLLYWAISRGQIDWTLLGRLFKNPLLCLALLAIIYAQLFASFYRWKLLLLSQEIDVPFKETCRLGMSAQFFQTLGPGTLGADVARGLYIARHSPTRKVRGLSTVFLDRLMGFFGMLFMGAGSFLVSLKHLEAMSSKFMPALISLGFFLCLASAGIVFGLLFLPVVVQFFNGAPTTSFRGRLKRVRIVSHVLEAATLYSDRRDFLWFGILISLSMHLLTVALLYLLSTQLFNGIAPLTLSEFYLGSSLGVLSLALPLAPSGIGVGQVAFSTIFTTLGWKSEAMGGSLVTALQVLTILVNMSGFFCISSGGKREKFTQG